MARMPKHVKGRSYDNATREAQSAETRERILDSARDLIVERGYRGATVAAIARRAGVHVDTVYELAGRKPVILQELIERAISGTGSAVAADDRDYVKAIRAEPEATAKLAVYAAAMRAIQSRMAPLYLALRDASATEPAAAAVCRRISERRAANMRRLAEDLQASGGLREGMSVDEAADVIWVTNSADVYVLLTGERGWSPERYERWLAETWRLLLLPDGGRGARNR